MPICPKCKENVEFLNYSSNNYDNGEFSIDKNGFKKYDKDGNSDLIEPDLFFGCPECNEELDFDEQQAEEFLREKDELQEIVAEKLKQIKEKNVSNL